MTIPSPARALLSILASLMVVLAAGCTGSPDGGQAGGGGVPSSSPAPRFRQPRVGDCYAPEVSSRRMSYLRPADMRLVDSCDVRHITETIQVGELTGPAARYEQPAAGVDLSEAYTACDAASAAFLGGDRHTGRVRLRVLPPSGEQWSAGARFFHCDLIEANTFDQDAEMIEREGSLKAALSGDTPPLAEGCSIWPEEPDDLRPVHGLLPAPCTSAHQLEFAGIVVTGPRAYPDTTDLMHVVFGADCDPVVAKYLGMTRSQLANHRQIRSVWWPTDRESWDNGDRSARCYATTFDNRTLTKPLKGAGNVKL
ncbi:septum formation family protein [Dactylosporangium sp. CA-092794]|uniref:septum formation family protein n=1 Tax=Dactylosporangium sp. CA-092794 TaxID=3239929 RepID=UPI003D8E85A6